MPRARTAILAGARAVVAESGVRHMTMSAVAEHGGVAKATIYNHFRSRGELLDGLLIDELTLLDAVAAAAGDDLADQLSALGRDLSANPVLAGLRRYEPEALLAMTAAATQRGRAARADAVAQAVAQRLAGPGGEAADEGVDLIIRWLCSLAWAPLPDDQVQAEAVALARVLVPEPHHVQ